MSGYTLNNFRKLPVSQANEISDLSFGDTDVLDRAEDIRVRGTNIDKALSLGKSKKCRTYIILKSGEKLYKIESNIMALDAGFVYAVNGLKIPLGVVYSVDFY